MKWRHLLTILLISSSAAPGQMALPAPTAQMPQTAQAPPPAPIAHMYAIYAHGAVPEQPYVDKNLKPVAEALKKLPFTAYEAISILDQEAPWGKETKLAVNAKYMVNVTPTSQDEEGTIGLQVRIEMLQGNGEYVNALDTHASAAERKALLFRGMPINNGELVVVLFLVIPSDDNEDGDNSEDQDQDQEEQEDQEEKQDSEEEKENDDSESQQEEQAEKEGEEEEPDGLENLDALLESLEDTDKREQAEERNQRNRIDFKGEWW